MLYFKSLNIGLCLTMNQDDILDPINDQDNSKLEAFLKSYPYGYKRKILILELIDQHYFLLETGYIKILKNTIPKSLLDINFKIWAFEMIDKVLDKIQDMPISDNARREIEPIIQSVIDELS